MKTILVGDLHLTAQIILPMVEEKLEELNCRQLVLLGDYTDAYNQTENSRLYLEELNYLLEFKRSLEVKGIKVVMLLGNHDAAYLTYARKIYSLHDDNNFLKVRELLIDLELQIAFELGDYLVSHAGYTKDYMLEEWHLKIIVENVIENVAWLNNHIGIYRGGQYISGSSLWADFEELTRFPNLNYRKQIVGHTPQKKIKIIKNSKIEIVGIDTFNVTPISQKPYYEQLGFGEVLLYENDSIKTLSLNWNNKEVIGEINTKFSRG